MHRNRDTSWEESEKWYDLIVGQEGHYYHQHIVIPGVIKLLGLKKGDSLLDLGCGQGILERAIPKEVNYHGVDLSSSLIKKAENLKISLNHKFSHGDVTKPYLTKDDLFNKSAFILSFQNLERPDLALKEAASHLKHEGILVIVLNHPCFRIPRQSSWGVDEQKKLQYRRIDRYLEQLKIPIQTHPGKGEASESTWTFHYPLSSITGFLFDAGFHIKGMEEWISNKTSSGKNAKMENRARNEFPLFLTIVAIKK